MFEVHLSERYHEYIACLNARDWSKLEQYVHADVIHNGKRIGLVGYRDMLVNDFDKIPDLSFKIGLLICESPYVASRLDFVCAPVGTFLGLAIDGKRIAFSENVFYKLRIGKIEQVWSVIDKAAIEAQL